MPASFDAELNLIFIGVAVPIPWGAIQRHTKGGDVLYTNSTLALNADTGAIEWYFQHIPGDNWDQDHPFERLIVETAVTPDADAVSWMNPNIISSERRKVITGIPGKPGIVWTLDAATGEFLWATETNYQNVIVGVDIEGRKGITNPEIDITEIGQRKLVCPTSRGGINWNSVGYSPQTNSLYTPTNNTCMTFFLKSVEPTVGQYHSSAVTRAAVGPEDDGLVGLLSSIDVATGVTRWTHRQRAGIGGSVLTTGGGLVFVSDDARRFRAFDAENGDILWEQILNSAAGGFPVSYSVEGVQYIAIAAGVGVNYQVHTPEIRQRSGGNILYVFRLP
jgi:glucose dehydrogenase